MTGLFSCFGRHRSARSPRRSTTAMQSGNSPRSTPARPREIEPQRRGSREVVASKYFCIPDTFATLEEVAVALRNAGLESSNLIIGIDFTKSNEWTGKHSFNNRSLHAVTNTPNPYEQAISIVGKTLASFDEDSLIPAFGFGDSTTHDQEVFSFHHDNSPCHGFEEVLSCYKKVISHAKLAGPTSFAPMVEAAINVVERSGGQYHVLIIIADGQVTRGVDIRDGDLSLQEKRTINSIVMASSYPLSIILVGVGDGPWDDMKKFDDKIPSRGFDNFQFVNFTSIMARNEDASRKESAFAVAALMEIPFQYRACMELGLVGHVTGCTPRVVIRPPPIPLPVRQQSRRNQSLCREPSSNDQQGQKCPVCLTNDKNLAFGCGHMCCTECSPNLVNCPICRAVIKSRLRVYPG